MGLKELLNKYDNYFSMNGWFSFGNEELKDISKSDGSENQNEVIQKIGKIRKQKEEARKE